MAAYAQSADVIARAGRVGGGFSVAGKRPTVADIDGFLTDTAVLIDEAVRGRGFDPAALDANAKAAFKDLNAYGALLRALAGMDPSDRPDSATELMKEARAVWDGAMGSADGSKEGSIASGKFPAIRALLAGQAGAGKQVLASAFQIDEPGYPTEGDWAEAKVHPFEWPILARGQKM